MSCSASENSKLAIANRKLAAAEQRRARKAAREPRSRLNSDSMTDEMPLLQAPKGILKNSHQSHQIPTKRSVSECVDDLTQIMADLNLSFAHGQFCRELPQLFDEEEEDDYGGDEREEDDDEEQEEQENCNNCSHQNNEHPKQDTDNNLKQCDCNYSNPTSGDSNDKKPKKSVRFNEHVYETFFFASRLYDRRQMAKYHFSSRHHPPTNQHQNSHSKQSKKARQRSKSESHEINTGMGMSNLKSDINQCKLSKSQRAKQSKKDKKKNSHKKEDSNDTNSDDQGYSSSHYSISD